VAGVQRWCAARVPEHARHQVRVECEVAHDTSRSSSGVPPGARTSGPNGPPFRSHACVTPPPTSPGPCTGATATFASTSTSPWLPHTRVEDLLTELDRDPASLGPTYQLRHQTAHSPPLRWGQLQPSRRGQFRLTSPPIGVAPLDDGSTHPCGGCNVTDHHASGSAVSFTSPVTLLPPVLDADGWAVAVVVAAAMGVRLPASPLSACRHMP
jgi:hypothetical protein